jgi:hypothetical protein
LLVIILFPFRFVARFFQIDFWLLLIPESAGE